MFYNIWGVRTFKQKNIMKDDMHTEEHIKYICTFQKRKEINTRRQNKWTNNNNKKKQTHRYRKLTDGCHRGGMRVEKVKGIESHELPVIK